MKMIKVKGLSPAVMSRIRNGHKVRLMKGEGTQLVVRPEQFNAIEKAFLKNKGIQLALSPEEIAANKTIEGNGIFGKKFDKALKKAGIKKAVYQMGAIAKPLVQQALDQGMSVVSQMAPELAPALEKAKMTAEQYLNDPKSLQGKKGIKELKRRAMDIASEAAAPMAAEYGVDVNELKSMMDSGSQVPMSRKELRAKGESALLEQMQKMVDARLGKTAAPSTDLYSQFDTDGILGNGMRRSKKGSKCCPMCCGSGLYAGAASGRGMPGMAPAREVSKKFVNLSRKLMGGELQALQSQATDANWQFRYTLPPAYQSI